MIRPRRVPDRGGEIGRLSKKRPDFFRIRKKQLEVAQRQIMVG